MRILMQELMLMLEGLVRGESMLFGVDVPDNRRHGPFNWVVDPQEWTEFHQEPKLSVGSLLEDSAGLQRVT